VGARDIRERVAIYLSRQLQRLLSVFPDLWASLFSICWIWRLSLHSPLTSKSAGKAHASRSPTFWTLALWKAAISASALQYPWKLVADSSISCLTAAMQVSKEFPRLLGHPKLQVSGSQNSQQVSPLSPQAAEKLARLKVPKPSRIPWCLQCKMPWSFSLQEKYKFQLILKTFFFSSASS